MLLCVPWPVLIYSVTNRERVFSTAALGNNRLFCLPSRHRFSLLSAVILFIYLLFSRSLLHTERVLNTFRHQKPGNRLLLHQSTFASAFLSLLLPFTLQFESYIFSNPTVIYLVSRRHPRDSGSLILDVGSLDYGWRNPLKISQRQRKPCPTINSKSCTQFLKALRWSLANFVLLSCRNLFCGAEEGAC